MKYEFHSNFSDHITAFISQKNGLGFPYIDSSRILSLFDKFCCDNFSQQKILSKEICLAWAIKRDTESNNTFRNRLMPIREFARYLNRIGVDAYVLNQNFAKKDPKYVPHIYSIDELHRIFHALDTMQPVKNKPIRHFVYPTLIRMLYCCGLRPGEAIKLQTQNINLQTGRIDIIESKCHKSRVVMMSDSILSACREYDAFVSKILPNRDIFFPNSEGNIYSRKGIHKTFHKILDEAKIQSRSGLRPRLYDFRHTYATHRLYQWMREGKDLNAMLPYLSAYMGHAQLSDTYYYIHLVPGIFENISGFDGFNTLDFMPEV